MGRSSRSPLLTVYVVLGAGAIVFVVVFVMVLAPIGIREARRRWFFYRIQNNPTCAVEDDCLPTMHCMPPEDGVVCVLHPEKTKGVCACSEWGIRERNLKVPPDAGGADGSP